MDADPGISDSHIRDFIRIPSQSIIHASYKETWDLGLTSGAQCRDDS